MTKLITFLILLGFSLISIIDNKQETEGIVITKETLKNDKGYSVNPRKD